MRAKNDPLPSKEETENETEKRLKILNKIVPKLKEFCTSIILAGSVAYGKNFSVRKESDIDLLLTIRLEDIEKLKSCTLFKITPKIEEAVKYFLKKEVAHFSITEKIEGVDTQYHFWEIEAQQKTRQLRFLNPKVYNIFTNEIEKIKSLDFAGEEHTIYLKERKLCEHGLIHEYPPYYIDKERIILRQPILNLIALPDILHNTDHLLEEDIEKIWLFLGKRLIQENPGLDLEKKNILNAIKGNWSFSPESRQKIKDKTNSTLNHIK